MNFLFVCGGTAGHVNPALSIAGELRRVMPDARFLFVGAGRAMEKRLIPAAGYELTNLKVSGLTRGISPAGIIKNAGALKNLALVGGEVERIINNFKPDIVIGTGGYVCYPVIKRASKLGIPTVIHESNAIPGLTAKLLSAVCDRVLIAFPGTEGQYRKPERVVYTGMPVRGEFMSLIRDTERRRLGLSDKPLVVSFWGSLGAERMNEAMDDFIKLNVENGIFDHIHATGGGERGLTAMKERLSALGMPDDLPRGIQIRAFIDDMPSVMLAADIVLCRAGASTIAELTIAGRPAVLVPSPYVPNNHQEQNARRVEIAGGAKVLLERECTGKKLYDTVSAMLSDKKALRAMEEAQKKLAVPDASDRILSEIISLIG